MYKTKLLLFLIALTFIPHLVFAQPIFRLSAGQWDLGSVKTGQLWEERFRVFNVGTEDLRIRTRTSCECLTVDPETYIVTPGANRIVRVQFFTKGYLGEQIKYVFFDTNDTENENVTFLVKANVIPKETVSPDESNGLPGEQIGTIISSPTTTIPILSPTGRPVIHTVLFTSANCLYCLELRQSVIPSLEKKYTVKLVLKEYLLDEPGNYERLILLEKKYNRETINLPALFFYDEVIGGRTDITAKLESVILKYKLRNGTPEVVVDDFLPTYKSKDARNVIKHRFKELNILPVIIAGLLDGINPCAFAVIIFFITYLLFVLNKPKKEVVYVGISFITGVFVAYFLLGLGLSRIVQSLINLPFFTRIFYLLVGLGMLMFAILSFRDAWILNKLTVAGTPVTTQEETVFLQLPGFLKNLIHSVIRRQAKQQYFVYFAFFTGLVVSVLELACTGQIFLPTIVYIINSGGQGSKGISLLLVYCLMFVVPLIIIFGLLYFGVTSEKIRRTGYQTIPQIKIAIGILFLFFAGYMLYTVFRTF